jgi:hypothetical protein
MFCGVGVILFVCLMMRSVLQLRVFENRVLRRIFGPKRDEVTGEWRKLHNEELRDLHSSPSKIRIIKSRRMRWTRHIAQMVKKRNADGTLAPKLEGNTPLRRPQLRRMNDIQMDVRGIGWVGVDWIDLAQDRYQLSSPMNAIRTSRRHLPRDRT